VSALSTWLQRTAAAQARRISVEEALLGGRFGAYARYRLRWVVVSRSVGFAVHVIEFLFLGYIFGSADLAGALAVLSGCALAAGAWWGALEVLRTRVRERIPATQARREVERWMAHGAVLGTLVLGGAAATVTSRCSIAGRPPSLVETYALVVCARLALDLMVRTFYSGVYARRRVWRPPGAIMATELSGFVAMVGLWPLLGPWGVPAGVALSTALSRALLVHYAARAYDGAGAPTPALRLRALRRPRAAARLERTSGAAAMPRMTWAALAGASNRLGSLLVLALLLDTRGSATGLVIAFHLVAPLLATAGSWAQVFYLDFRRLEAVASAGLRRQLARALVPLGLAMAVGLWAAGVAVVLWRVGPAAGAAPVLALLPLFLAHSQLGRVQLQYFAQGEHRRVALGALALGAALVVGLGALDALGVGHGLASRTLTLACATALAALLVGWHRARPRPAPGTGHLRSLHGWLRALVAVKEPVRVGVAEVRTARVDQLRHLGDRMADRLGERGAVTVASRRVCWFERGGGASQLHEADVLVMGAGLVDALRITPACASGEAALDAAVEAGMLPRPAQAGESLATVERLVEAFRAAFPGGLCMRFDQGGLPTGDLARMAPEERQALWGDAVGQALGGSRRRGRSAHDVTVFTPGGEIAAVFALPRAVPPADRRTWRDRVDQANWAASVGERAAEGHTSLVREGHSLSADGSKASAG
jgi:hypothetical protein